MNANTLPPVVALMLTGSCPSHCYFCYGPPPSTATMSPDLWMGLLGFLRNHGARALLVSGGEPVAYPGVDIVLGEAKRLGFRTSLATSCPAVTATLRAARGVDWCEVSVHGSRPEIHESVGRSRGNLSVVLSVLAELSPLSAPKIKVNTVVTPKNAADLPELARVLAGFRLDTWKLLEVRPRGLAKVNLPDVLFNFASESSFMEDVRIQAGALMPGTRIVVSPAVAGDRAYVIIDPDGRTLVPNGTDYIDVGSIADVRTWTPADSEDFLARLSNAVVSRYVSREFETSFEMLGEQ